MAGDLSTHKMRSFVFIPRSPNRKATDDDSQWATQPKFSFRRFHISRSRLAHLEAVEQFAARLIGRQKEADVVRGFRGGGFRPGA